MSKDEVRRGFLKGYEAGLKSAWEEVLRLTSKGFSATELSVVVKSKMANLKSLVDSMARKVDSGEYGISEKPVARVVIASSGSYMIREGKAAEVFSYFSGLLSKGVPGLCITRIPPREVQEKYGLRDARLLWLSKTSGGKKAEGVVAYSPTDLVRIATYVSQFLQESSGGAVLLEGLEYLISHNGFAPVLRFVQTLNEKTVVSNSYLLLSVDPVTLKEQEYALLTKEAQEV